MTIPVQPRTLLAGVVLAFLLASASAAPVPGATDPAGDKLADKTGKNVVKLPGPVAEVALGGGGRYLVLHLASERKLAVFDTHLGKVVKYLPVAEDVVQIAAGLDKLVVYLPGADVFQRYDLNTLEREATTKSPLGGGVQKLLLGSASRGPLIAFHAGTGGPATVLDPTTLKPTGVEFRGGAEGTWRISGDGRLLAVYAPNLSPQGHTLFVRAGNEYRRVPLGADHNFAGHLTPGPAGRYLYAARGQFNSAGRPVGKQGSYNDGSRFALPAAEGEVFSLRIEVPGFPHGDGTQAGTLFLHLAGDDRPVAALPSVETPTGLNTWGREAFGHDRRFYLVPSARLLVVLPPAMDHLALYRVDVAELLGKCDHDFVAVLSSPPREAERGKPFAYSVVAKARKGNPVIKLESGPPGMKATADGKVTWDVPADYAEEQVEVLLTASANGQEVFHSFTLTPTGGKAPQP